MALIAMLAAPALLAPATLQRQVEGFAGQPAIVDPRLLLPECAQPDFAWSPGGRSVTVHCAAPEWQVFVPIGGVGAGAGDAIAPPESQRTARSAPASNPSAIRRGDRVSLEFGGPGFVIAMDAVADGDSKDGRVAVRPVAGGRRLNAVIDGDGHVRLH